MDKEHAKFILQSYRPDGADAGDPAFAEALQLAAEDRELGEWLARERAHDSIFVQQLSSLDIPEGLRDEILAGIAAEQGASSSDDLDGFFIGAMSSVEPPAGLRDQILSAMEVEKTSQVTESAEVKDSKVIAFPRNAVLALTSIAAAVAVGFIVAPQIFGDAASSDVVTGADPVNPTPNNPVIANPVITDPVVAQPVVNVVNPMGLMTAQMQSGKIVKASNDIQYSDNIEGLNKWLNAEGVPAVDSIPQGLIQVEPKGGSKVVFDNGSEASMILFDKKDVGEFYMMVLESDSVADVDSISKLEEVKLKSCDKCPLSHLNISSWRDMDKVYMLLTKVDEEELIELF